MSRRGRARGREGAHLRARTGRSNPTGERGGIQGSDSRGIRADAVLDAGRSRLQTVSDRDLPWDARGQQSAHQGYRRLLQAGDGRRIEQGHIEMNYIN